MPMNWNALFQGLGQGLSGLGQNLGQQRLIDEQQNRQKAQDALQRLTTLSAIGGVQLPSTTDPNAAVTQASDYNHLRSGGAVPNSALGVPDDSVPDAYGSPTTIQLPGADGKLINVLIDPSKTPQALAERRFSLTQAGLDRRQDKKDADSASRATAAQAATAALEAQREQGKTLAGQKQAKADYATLRALNPKHVLVQQPFDPDNAANYGSEVKFEQAKQLANLTASNAAANRPADWVSAGVDANGQPLILNARTGETKSGGGIKQSAAGGAAAGKEASLAGDIEQAIPIMTALAPKVSGTKVSIAMQHPMAGNVLLNEDEKKYVTAARTFLAGVLHLESGARLSKEQWEIGVTRYLPLPDDPPSVVQQKINAARETARQRMPAPGGRGAPPPNVPHPTSGDTPGNVTLGSAPAAPKAKGKDYGIFTPPGGDE